MKKIFSKFVSLITAGAVSLFVSSGSLQSFVNESKVFAAENAIIYGDVNNDKQIDVFDLSMIKREILNPGTSIDLIAADVNADGIVDVQDAVEVQDYLLCRISSFSIHHKEALNSIKSEIGTLDYSIVTPNEDIETSLTAEMASIINEMGNPIEVYEFLYNTVNTEFYFGSRKGAIGTYEQHGGNDIDQASLLIAALHYLGYEADYISALVELSPQQAMDITATSDVEIAFKILGSQVGSETKVLSATYDENSEITSIIIEHTWVKAKLPSRYINSDNSDELVEVQLDTSFKPLYRSSISASLSSVLGSSNVEKLNEYVVNGNSSEIDSIVNELSQKYDGKELSEIFPTKEMAEFNVIPTSSHQIVSTNTIEGSEYLDGRRDQILFNIAGKDVAVLTSAEAYGKRLVIEYDFDSNYDLYEEILLDMPETIFDITSFHTQSGIGVQAYIKLDGQTIGSGASVPIGTEQTMTISLYTGGAVNELKTTNMLSGSMYAITIDTQNIASYDIYKSMQEMSEEISRKSFRETYNDEYLGSYLSAIGKLYMSEADVMKTTYADEYNVHPERYLSICVTSFNLDMELDIVGQLEVNEKGTIGLDVKSDSYTAVSLTNSQEALDLFYLNAGIRGSYLESEVLESVTGIESVSTMKLFDVAKENDIEIISISKNDSDYSSKLEGLNSSNISAFALNEITEYVEAGYEVIVPSKNIQINSWSGTGYIVVTDNSYDFMLSNGTNGGEMTIPWDEWNKNAGDEFIEGLYWTAFVMAFASCIVSGIAVVAVFPVSALTIGTVVSALAITLGFAASLHDLYTTGNDLVDYYNGDTTPKQNVTEFGTIAKDIFIMVVEWALKPT